jgi:hemoglobin/transferrin/lactoferrin receptor protein
MRLLFTILVSILSTLASAQEKNTVRSVDSSFFIEQNMAELVIAATRFPEKSKFIPQSVLSLPFKKIEQLNQPTVADLLMQTGQVAIQKSQLGGGSPIIRGFEANKVLIVVDGIRMNNAIFRGGHLQNVIAMDNNYLDKVEVLFGPASVIYGSDALGGVMCFYTKKPELVSNGGRRKLKIGSAIRYSSASQENHAHVDVNAGWKQFGSFSSFSFSNFGDLLQGKNRSNRFPTWGLRPFEIIRSDNRDSMRPTVRNHFQSPTGYTQYDMIQKFLLKIGETEHNLNFQFSTTSDVPRYDRLTELSGARAKFAEWYYGPQERLLASYRLTLPEGKLFDKGQIITAFQQFRESRHNRKFGIDWLEHRFEKVKVISLNADFFNKSGKNELNYGIEFTHNTVQSRAQQENIVNGALLSLDTRYPDGGSSTYSSAAYGSLLKKIGANFSLNAGSRFTINQLDSKFVDTSFFPFPFESITQKNIAISGNAGFVFAPRSKWKITGLISSGFRTPNVDDISKVYESNNGNLIIPNPDIKPERTLNYELGANVRIRKKIKADLNLWYTDYRNILTLDSGLFNGSRTVSYQGVNSVVFSMVNKDKAYLWGSGLNVIADLLNPEKALSLQFITSINYTYGRIVQPGRDYPLDHIPPLFGRSGLTATKGRLTVELSIIFNGSKDSSDYNLKGEDNHVYSADPVRGYTPSWNCLNIRSSLTLGKFLCLQLALENINDRFYRAFASGISSPGRNFVISLRGNFQ